MSRNQVGDLVRAARAPQPAPRAITPKPSGPKDPVPTKEEFEAWAQLPVTRWVALVMANMAEVQKSAWVHMSWVGGVHNPEKLTEYRTRADAYMAFIETPYERYLDNG